MYTSVQSFETEQGGGDSFTVHAEVCTYEANGVDVSASEITVEPPPMPPPGPAYVGPDGQPIYGHQVPACGSCSYYPQSQPYPGQYAPPPPGMMYGGTPFAGAAVPIPAGMQFQQGVGMVPSTDTRLIQQFAPPREPGVPRKKRDNPFGAAKWSAQEEDMLRSMVAEAGTGSWARVAETLSLQFATNRTASGVNQHWQIMCGKRKKKRVDGPKPRPTRWTAEEEVRLRDLVEHANGQRIWRQIAEVLGTQRSPCAAARATPRNYSRNFCRAARPPADAPRPHFAGGRSSSTGNR